jgi:pimeloyl-ACP methyl ester carboxylesterase
VPLAEIDGIEVYYEVHGDGPALLLIPGLGADIRMFSGISSALAERRRVVMFDPRGAGRSAKPDIPYSIDGMADDAAGLLRLLGIEHPTVVGYSMGGRIALSLALRHAALVGRLVLASTSAHTPPVKPFGWRWFVMDVLSRVPVPKAIDAQPRFAFARQRQASRTFDCSDRLAQITMPTLVLHGRNDHLVPVALAEELGDHVPDARVVTVAGGHMALVTTQRRRFVQELLAFSEPTTEPWS